MIFIITDKNPSVGQMHTYEGVKFATRIGDETLLSDVKPEVKGIEDRQLLYAFDIPTDQYNERLDYVITGMRRRAHLPDDFPVIREWVDRGEGAEQITFRWWEITIK